VALAVIAIAPSTPVLLLGMAALGLLAVMTQVLVAFAASLGAPGDRGRVIGTLTSGVVLGILAARILAGVASDVWGWRAAYIAAAVLTSLVAMLLRRALPTVPPAEPVVRYRQLVTSMASLVRFEPVLRTRAVLAVITFGTLSVLWSSLALALTSAPRPLSNGAIGLIGVVGLAGATAARRAGRLADRGLAHVTTGVALAAMTLAWVPIALLTRSLGALVLGLLVLDGAVQAVHVTSQSMITNAVPDARSRAVAAYMLFYALGPAGGSIASTATYASAGWLGVSILGAGLGIVGLSVWLATLPGRSGRHGREGSWHITSEMAMHHGDEGVDELTALRTRRAVPGAALGWVADGQRDDAVAGEIRRHDPRRHHGHGVARCDRLDQQVGAECDRGEPPRTRTGRDRQWHDRRPRLVVALAQHEIHVGEVGGGETGPAGQRMAGVDDSSQLVVEQPLEPNVVDIAGELGDQGDIETIVEQGGDRVVVGQHLEAQLGVPGSCWCNDRMTSVTHWKLVAHCDATRSGRR
jgi:predicted MFS family arabinose efflux permease